MPSADWTATLPACSHAGPSFTDLVQAWIDCRRHKRNTASALAFEQRAEPNLVTLYDELIAGTYRPGRSICFIVTRPKPREVWAAAFRDRIVHHLLYNHIAPRFYARFIADSCACIPGRGTLYAARRLEHHVRGITRNWSQPAHYLKCDLANFFVSIDKRVLREQLARHITEPWWLGLTETILFHDPRTDFELHSGAHMVARVPTHKRLAEQPAHLGLPIGNLSSQFFANVYLDALDQRIKHHHRARYYVRYVDDFVILDESPQHLNEIRADIERWLPATLHAYLNPAKTILQPIDRGIDFVGHVLKPWRRTTRRRTVHEAIRRTAVADDVFITANSYFGLLGQASHSHHDRTRLSNTVRRRGHVVPSTFHKTYRKADGRDDICLICLQRGHCSASCPRAKEGMR